MRFLRCLRLDSSDLHALPRAAEPGEWAVAGSFAFAGRDLEGLAGKEKLAFQSGWLGTGSFGWSTLAEVAEIEEAAFFQVVETLARHFVEAYGAPDLTAALPAAREEADYARSLADHKLNTLLAIERRPAEEGIAERVRIIRPERARDHARIWEIHREDPDEAEPEA